MLGVESKGPKRRDIAGAVSLFFEVQAKTGHSVSSFGGFYRMHALVPGILCMTWHTTRHVRLCSCMCIKCVWQALWVIRCFP